MGDRTGGISVFLRKCADSLNENAFTMNNC
uniref:Uncharacterized protein n=1 Tax=Anguilla anguilla TaxID=7936 RepID=A0A0E9VBA2_ANGAN